MASDEAREAKAAAKAETAREKAMRPWYKKKRFIFPGLLLVLIIAGALGSGAGDDPDTTPIAANSPGESSEGVSDDAGGDDAPENVGIGQPARDGKFEFAVHSLECGVDEVGEDFLAESPQGQFCVLEVTVENIGTEAQFLSATDQYLLNPDGVQYSASFEASFAYNQTNDVSVFDEINPGNSITAAFVFDVPPDADIVSAELHDSAFSGGVLVDLG